ncbi:MAG: hypothetical protein NTZ03_04245 [Actinobacteria bacterium]|nr:hypothetical protein [Actinomycetota bacterium]
MAVVRFKNSGTADASFNRGKGFAIALHMHAERAMRLSDGSLLFAGTDANSEMIDPTPTTGIINHLSSSGVPDVGYGSNGTLTVRASTDAGTSTALWGIAVGLSGGLTFAGSTASGPTGYDKSTNTAVLLSYTTSTSAPRKATIEARLSNPGGLFRICGTTLATACRTVNSWYYMGNAWPLEAHNTPRVIVQLERRNAAGAWIRSSTTSFITDTGNFRASATPRTVGTYRVRAVVPASHSTVLTYAPWRYFCLQTQ